MIEEPLRDLSDLEYAQLTLDQRKALAKQFLHLKREIFHPNIMLMHSTFLSSELRELAHHEGQMEYVE